MRLRLAIALMALSLTASAETMSLEQLYSFVQSSAQFIKEGKMTDKELASFLAKSKLSEKLDDRSLEQIQGLGVGPKSLEALRHLQEESKSLAVAKIVEPAAKPQQPPPSSEEQAELIANARNYSLNYSKQLPDFICTQVTRRYAAPRPRSNGLEEAEPSWRSLDTLTVRLSYFDQQEDYKLVLINNAPTNLDYRNVGGGAISTGEFGSMLKEIFERATEARFEWDHWATLRARPAMAFAYHVSQARSKWHVTYNNDMDVVPAYRGLVYIDKETHEVVRVTLEAEGLPPGFPVKSAQMVMDYGYQDLSGRQFLLPLKARTIMYGDDMLSRNDEEFRLYRKYSAESEIKFDTETPPPLSEDQTRETPLPGRK
jgi:hypothetical protein